MKKAVFRKKTNQYISKLSCKCALLFAAIIFQQDAYSAIDIHFSKFRFVFDEQFRQDALVLSNNGRNAATCKLSIENFLMSANGPLKLATEDDVSLNSAEKLIRLSPRRVTLNAASKQTVRIASRRRPNTIDGEYLSYLKISCIESLQTESLKPEQISVDANFIYYIPVQVRVGQLSASTNIENAKISFDENRYSVSFSHIREGDRSVIGEINIIEQKSGESLGKLANTVIYTPFTERQHTISLSSKPEGPVDIIFTEDEVGRGNLAAKITVQP